MPRSYPSMFVMLALGALGAGCSDGNHPPKITVGPKVAVAGLSETALEIPENTLVELQLEVNDEDGDELQFTWRQEPAEPRGQFSNPAAQSPTWVTPEADADHEDVPFFLYVNVQDGNGAGLLARTPPIYIIKR